jgi:hypothetical protein
MQQMSDDLDTQILGLVAVKFVHRISPKDRNDPEGKALANRIFHLSAVRMSAVHICLPDTFLGHAYKATLILAGSLQDRMRIRTHVGSVTECLYALKSFGIPTKYFPPDLKRRSRDYQRERQRSVDKLAAREAILEQRRREYERFGQSGPFPFFAPDLILRPHHEDCLFGKGMPTMNHHGNIAMRMMLEQRWEAYDSAKYGEKMEIAWEIVHKIKCGQGRFLKEESNGLYTKVDDETAREKISIAFRDIVRRIKKQKAASHKDSPHQQSLVAASLPAIHGDPWQPIPLHPLYQQQQLPMAFQGNDRFAYAFRSMPRMDNGTLDLSGKSHQHKRRKCGENTDFMDYFCNGD